MFSRSKAKISYEKFLLENNFPINSWLIDLSSFEQQNLINEKSNSRVYKVIRKETKMIYAAEVFHSFQEIRFCETLINMSKLKHRSILQLIGFSFKDFQHNNNPVIITEYSKNGLLSEDILQLITTQKTDYCLGHR